MLMIVGEKTSMIYLGCFIVTSALTHIMAHTAVAATISLLHALPPVLAPPPIASSHEGLPTRPAVFDIGTWLVRVSMPF